MSPNERTATCTYEGPITIHENGIEYNYEVDYVREDRYIPCTFTSPAEELGSMENLDVIAAYVGDHERELSSAEIEMHKEKVRDRARAMSA